MNAKRIGAWPLIEHESQGFYHPDSSGNGTESDRHLSTHLYPPSTIPSHFDYFDIECDSFLFRFL